MTNNQQLLDRRYSTHSQKIYGIIWTIFPTGDSPLPLFWKPLVQIFLGGFLENFN